MRLKPLLILAVMLTPLVAHSQDAAVTKFKDIAQRVEQALSPSPPIFNIQNFPDIAGGKIAIAKRLVSVSFAYDVKTTNSLLTPIVGVISTTVMRQTTQTCGSTNIKYLGPMTVTLDEAVQTASRPECWKGEPKLEPCRLRFTYGYREGNWEFAGIADEQGHCSVLLEVALGRKGYYTELNAPWKGLIPGL